MFKCKGLCRGGTEGVEVEQGVEVVHAVEPVEGEVDQFERYKYVVEVVEEKVEGHVEVEQFEMEILSREMTEIERTRQTIDDTRVVSIGTKVKTNTQVHEYADS